MGERRLEYPTHSIIIRDVDNTKFVKATNLVKDMVYDKMLNACLINQSRNFVSEERNLLSNFVKSLTSFHNRKEDIFNGTPKMYTFGDETEYHIFCMINELPYCDQEWFNTIYIKTTLLHSIPLFINASVAFLKILYPEHYNKPVDLLKEVFRDLERSQNQYKCDINIYKNFLIQNNIAQLYHFSNRRNLESIKLHGLCSISELTRLGISAIYSSSEGSRSIDTSKQLLEYVHLSYERDTPMLYVALAEGRLYEHIIFEINPEVIFHKDTKFSDVNAASNNAIICSDINFFLNLPFSSFHNKNYNFLPEQLKKNYQAEVLVKNNISTKLIFNLNEI